MVRPTKVGISLEDLVKNYDISCEKIGVMHTHFYPNSPIHKLAKEFPHSFYDNISLYLPKDLRSSKDKKVRPFGEYLKIVNEANKEMFESSQCASGIVLFAAVNINGKLINDNAKLKSGISLEDNKDYTLLTPVYFHKDYGYLDR